MILDDCYISFLNLDHRTDRLLHMHNQLNNIEIMASRTRGRLPGEFDLSDIKLQVMRRRTPGAIPCHYGQVEIMQTAYELNKHAFVMEDDLIFCTDFKKRMEYISKWSETHEWDIIWLGGTYHINPGYWHRPNNPEMPGSNLGRDAELTDDPRIIRTFGAFSTHAYIVNKNSIKKILYLLEENVHLSMGIDWIMIKIQPQLQTFSFAPGCVIQKDNQSDIGQGITVYSGFSKLGAHWFNDSMDDFDPLTYNWAEARV